jgi:competence protein ComEC
MSRWLPIIILILLSATRVVNFCNTHDCSSNGIRGLTKEETSSLIQGKLKKFRTNVIENTYTYLPSPHSELLLGMVLGIDNLDKVPKFEEALKTSGTVHVVVVSGFNISLIFGLVIGVIGTRYKLRNLLLAEFITLIYAVVAGFEPPVVRAFIMGSISSWGKYYGRLIDTIQILLFSGCVMILINPLYFFSLSFQLSFLATLSLLMFSDLVSKLMGKVLKGRWSENFFAADFSTSLAAQVLVWPFISFHFGRVSLLSPFINALILWSVPVATVLGIVLVILMYISPVL